MTRAKSKNSIEISIITPCFNEEENIEASSSTLRKVMRSALPKATYEHIFVDNYSTDRTFEILKKIASTDKNIKVIRNSRNVGPFYNMWIGLENATGNYIVPLLPADLQDPAEIIPQMYSQLKSKKVLIVYGVITSRKEFFFLRFLRRVYYKIISRLADAKIPLNSGEFLMADKRVVETILETKDHYPYLRGMFAQSGAPSSPIYYQKKKRIYGKSKENMFTLFNHAMNGFISTSRIIPRIILAIGSFIALLSLFMGIYNLINFLFDADRTVQRGVPTILITMFFLSGIQLLLLGMVSEYIQAIYRQIRPSPRAFVLDKINFNQNK
jgi:polyisoprenyl-phosphate glycosyltransferase